MIHGWLYSLAIHGVLLLGAALVGFGGVTVGDPGSEEGGGISCSVRDSGPTIGALARGPEFRIGTPILPEPPAIDLDPGENPETVGTYGPLSRPGWYLVLYDPGVGVCGNWLLELDSLYQGRVLFLTRAEFQRINRPPRPYADQKASRLNNASGSPRLRRLP